MNMNQNRNALLDNESGRILNIHYYVTSQQS